MSKELECLDRIDTKNYLTEREHREFYSVVESALNELQSIKNTNPSEALECLERIDNTLCLNNIKGKLEFGIDTEEHTDCDSVIGMTEDLETIKQALLKAQENARSEEILQKYYQEGITLDSVRALKEENAELRKKAQFLEEEYNNLMEDKDNLESELFKQPEPKQYLKWEDLEFNIDKQMMTVLLNGTKYTLVLGRNMHIDKLAFLRNGEINYYFLEDDKQFFNDLRLERVEE